MNEKHHSAYDYHFLELKKDTPMSLDNFRGKVIVVVNTASRCGFTPQYRQLEALYQRYKDQGLVVLGIPSNDFGAQEPGSNDDIAQFCEVHYGVSFPMMQKEQVKGPQAHPFYQWARQQCGAWSVPRWNFHKYVIDRNGQLADYFYSFTSPQSKRFTKVIEGLLAS